MPKPMRCDQLDNNSYACTYFLDMKTSNNEVVICPLYSHNAQ